MLFSKPRPQFGFIFRLRAVQTGQPIRAVLLNRDRIRSLRGLKVIFSKVNAHLVL